MKNTSIDISLGVVIVTFNRLEKLKKTLKCYEDQTYRPSYIIVVNNNSMDGTKEYLEKWKMEGLLSNKIVINLDKNKGGSGGFSVALKKAIELNSKWIWISDDDAYPAANSLEFISRYIISHSNENIAAICGKVVDKNGNIDFDHRRCYTKQIIRNKQKPVPKKLYDCNEPFEIDIFSYVGTVIKKDVLQKAGVTNEQYFIWYDDTEHSMRIRKFGKIICLPYVVINHDVVRADDKIGELSWKWYYGVRNQIDAYKRNESKLDYFFIILAAYYKLIIYSKNIKDVKMFLEAIKNGKEGKLGIEQKYRPPDVKIVE